MYILIRHCNNKTSIGNKLGQFIFSGAANHIDFSSSDERQFGIGFGNAVRFIADEFRSSGLTFSKGFEKLNNVPNLAFCYPDEFDFLESQYKIGYMPWESTELKNNWEQDLNRCDEVWTTSPWSQKILEELLDVPVFVYSHGVPKFCVPQRRKKKNGEIIRFLHVGEPALRKGGQDVVDAFIELFGNNPDYQLIMKCSQINTTRVYDDNNQSLGTPPSHYKNIVVIEDYFPDELLLALYKQCDVFLYPSYGEGFGFNAAYAIAMGMPTICTAEWASYKDFITLPIDGEYVDSPWPSFHPGQMVQPDLNQMKKHMINVSENYDYHANAAWPLALGIHEQFNWTKVSEKPIKRLKKIISLTSKH